METNIEYDPQQLLLDLQRGDGKAWNYFFKLRFRPLVYYSMQIVGDQRDAEEIVDEVFLRLWQHKGNFKTMGDIKPWLYTVTKNACFNYYLKNAKLMKDKKSFMLDVARLEKEVEGIEIESELLHGILLQRISQLPPKLKKTVLYFLSNYDLKRISKLMDCSLQVVRNNLHRAIKQLRAEGTNFNR
jgi:RNA polymerase sigma factor (sigma-70 family)